MPLLRYDRPSSNSGDFDNPQVVPLRQMWYIGALARVSAPWMKKNPATGKEDPQVTVSFLVTHGAGVRGYDALDDITEGVSFLRPKQFYSPKTGMASAMTTLWRALLDTDFEDVLAMADEELDFDKVIGNACMFECGVGEKPNPKNGLYVNRINPMSFMPADEQAKLLIAKFMKKAEISTSKNGAVYIAKPRAAELPEGQTVQEYLRRPMQLPMAPTGAAVAAGMQIDGEVDEVPF